MSDDFVSRANPSQAQTLLLTKKRAKPIQFYTVVGLLVLIVSGIVFWFSGSNNFFTAKFEVANPPAANVSSKQDEQLQLEVANLASNLANAGQKMLLLTWKAIKDPDFSADDMAIYDKEMSSIISEIAKSHVLIKAMDKSTFDKITLLSQEMHKVDTAITLAGIDFRQSKKRDLSKWQELYDQSKKYTNRVLNEMPEIMNVKNP